MPRPALRRYGGVSSIGEDPLTLLDDDGNMSPEGEAVGMVIPDDFRILKSRSQLLWTVLW